MNASSFTLWNTGNGKTVIDLRVSLRWDMGGAGSLSFMFGMKHKTKTMRKLILSLLAVIALTACQSPADGKKADAGDASGFVLLTDYVPDAILEIRYYSTYNFVGRRIDGYEQPTALLTKPAAEALAKAAASLKAQGYRLKIYDAYRPQKGVDHFVRWSKDVKDTLMKAYFYPELGKDVLFPQDYIMEKSGHTRGSTLDLTIFDMAKGKEVDMGGTFDYFGERSHPDFKGDLTEQQRANRMILRKAMVDAGFEPLYSEWWHFTLKNEPYPDTYFNFPVSEESVKANRIK